MYLFLQPLIPNYREDFFTLINEKINLSIYCYDSDEKISRNNLSESSLKKIKVKSIKVGPLLIYSPIRFFKNDKHTAILMLSISHITTWLLLLTKFIHKRKIILWGHGISIKNYSREAHSPNKLREWMILLADGVWFYTENEYKIWKKRIPLLNAVPLGNTISGLEKIRIIQNDEKQKIKEKFNIKQEIIFIICTRFNEKHRKVGLLLNLIESLNTDRFGFIIIGEGIYKPKFDSYTNVFDFGSVYERSQKDSLFGIADIYFQPGYLGLSVVEAMAYHKPVFTFKRNKKILQGVEYGYIKHGVNGMIFNSLSEMIEISNSISKVELLSLGHMAKEFVENELTMDKMVENALSIL
jgi:hypothetical protein